MNKNESYLTDLLTILVMSTIRVKKTTESTYESTIIACGEADYAANISLIHKTFSDLVTSLKSIRVISERVLELILENNDLYLLKKYSHYCGFVILQSHSHYCEYADLHGAKECLEYLKLLHWMEYSR
ncbi:hypothetical protein F-liban_109 [Faustovirus]|nr:hypothetical protein F-liban_109 [Faustovirus]SME64785.1 Hypothetical protein FSTVST1_106 [Faustovirus ST1]